MQVNLIDLVKYHPYDKSTFADHAGVTGRLFDEILKGNDNLTDKELRNVSSLIGIDVNVLKCNTLIMLNKDRIKHQAMIKKLCDDVSYLGKYMNHKSVRLFIKGRGYYHYSKLVNDFYGNNASYVEYFGVNEEVKQVVFSLQLELSKPVKRDWINANDVKS